MLHLSSYTALSAMNNYDTAKRPLYVVSMENMTNKANKTQVNLTVKDGVSLEKVAIFDTDVATLTEIYPFMQNGKVLEFNITKKEPYYNADQNITEVTQEFDLSEIAEKAVENPEKYFDYVLNEVNAASQARADDGYDSLDILVRDVYLNNKERLLRSSSAVAYHHTGISGNILHTAEVVNMCDVLTKSCIGRDIDKELLIAAAALHDVGKTDCYATDAVGVATMTLQGIAYGGHHLDSIRAVEEAEKNGNYNPERLLLLKNIIASHHGAREFGDIATPICIEAYWLHYMDDLDAKHYQAKKAIMEIDPGTVTAQKVRGLGTNLYRRIDQ